jgi:recombination protein RecA
MSDLQKALEALHKKFDNEVIMRYGDKPKEKIPVISTSLPSLDAALGIGGLPKGRLVEIYGPESSGKTTLALTVIAEAQKEGGVAAFIDAEHALDPVYAQNIGVDMDNVIISQPDNGEQALEVVDALVRTKNVDVIVVDSVAALVPKSELDGEMGDQAPGKQARLMSQAMRKLAGIASKNGCLVIFINQLREKIGVTWGSPEVTTGGKALKFSTSIRLDIRRIGAVKDGEANVGNLTRVKVVKNKLAAPHKEAEFSIIYGEGMSKELDLLDQALLKGTITKGGSWFKYNDVNLAQGRENVRKALKDKDLFQQVLDDLSEEKQTEKAE